MMSTTPGMILGTAPYMSPEQVNGREADRTSDVWAFGCVLYEMLTGFRAFEGDTVSEVLARVLKTDPDWQRLPSETPESIRRLLRRSLQKDQKLRFRDIRDASLEIDDVQSGTQRDDPHAGGSVRTSGAAGMGVGPRDGHADCCGVGRAGFPSSTHRSGGRVSKSARLQPGIHRWRFRPTDSRLSSPPGPEANHNCGCGRWTLRRRVRCQEPSAHHPPFWSPDSRSLGFFADAKLKRMDIDGGSVKTLVSVAPVPLGGAWNSENTIVFSASPGRPIFRVSAEGGEPSAVTRFESPTTKSFCTAVPSRRSALSLFRDRQP